MNKMVKLNANLSALVKTGRISKQELSCIQRKLNIHGPLHNVKYQYLFR